MTYTHLIAKCNMELIKEKQSCSEPTTGTLATAGRSEKAQLSPKGGLVEDGGRSRGQSVSYWVLPRTVLFWKLDGEASCV